MQLVAAYDVGPWWFTLKSGQGGGYFDNAVTPQRSAVVQRIFLDADLSEMDRNLLCSQNATLLVSTPDTQKALVSLAVQGNLRRETEWIFALMCETRDK